MGSQTVSKPSGTTRVVDGNILKSRVTTVTEYDPHEMRGVIEHLRVEACGRTRLANLLMFREWDPKTGQQTGRLRAMGLLDGNSIAEPRLQMDAVPDAAKVLLVQAVRAQPKECPTSTALNTFRFGQTIVLKPPVDKAWTELWPATVCGQPYAALMEFTPNPKGPGTQFKVSPFSLLNATAAATTKP